MGKEYTECLLENKFHVNCPGSKVDQVKRLRSGFPFSELFFHLDHRPRLLSQSKLTVELCINARQCANFFVNIGVCLNRLVDLAKQSCGSKSKRGAANGIGMTAMSLFKTVGPAGAGILFSWSERRLDAAFLPGSHLVFFVLNVIVVVGVALTFKPFLTTARK